MKKETLWVFTLSFLQFFLVLDFVIIMPLAPVLMRDFGINSAQFGLVLSSYNLAAAPAALIVGNFIDRFERKSFNTFITFLFILGTFLCGFSKTYEQFLIARVFTGAFSGILGVSILAILASLITEERRGRATGAVMSSFSFASVIGVPLGLEISDFMGWRSSFIAIATLSFIPLVMSWFIFPQMSDHLGKTVKKLSRYIKLLQKENHKEGIFIVSTITFSSFLMIPFLSILYVHNLGLPETKLSFVYFFGGLATICSSFIIGRLSDKWGSAKAFLVFGPISFIPMLLVSHMGKSEMWVILVVTTIFMAFVAGRFIPCMSLVTKIPAAHERGTYMSLASAARSFGSAISTYFGGLILIENSTGAYENFNHVVYLSMFAVCLVLALMYRSSKSLP